MFTWVCPRCGRENSPSYTECPDCKVRDAAQATEEVVGQPLPVAAPDMTRVWQQPPPQQAPQPAYAPPQYAQPPQYAPQVPQYAPQQPQYAPPAPVYQQPQQYIPPQPQYVPPPAPQPQYVPPAPQPVTQATTPVTPRQLPPMRPAGVPPRPSGLAALPVWLLMILFTVVFLALGAGIYYGYRAYSSGSAGFTGGNPPATAVKAKPSNPLQKYIEVVGVRLTNDAKKKPVAKYLIVNHSDGVMTDLSGTVTLWASTSRSEEDSVGSFLFHIDSLKPNDAKDVVSPLKTKLKMYELPDWQNLTAEVQITSPQP